MKTAIRSFYCVLFWTTIWVSAGLASTEQWVGVDQIIDGDTIRLKDGRVVRYLGIDAPEIDHRRQWEEPYGFAAREANRQWVGTHKVRIVTANFGSDHYGRTLAQVISADGTPIGQRLVEHGYATVLKTPASEPIDAELLSAQRIAMTRKTGKWKSMALNQGPYNGNLRSSRFHLPTCPLGKKIHRKNRLRFNTLWEAYWHGFAPCNHCLPASLRSIPANQANH